MSAAFATFLALIISIWPEMVESPFTRAYRRPPLPWPLPPAPSPEEPPLSGSTLAGHPIIPERWHGSSSAFPSSPSWTLARYPASRAREEDQVSAIPRSQALCELCAWSLLAARPGCSGFFGVPLCRFPILIENERIDFFILYFAWFIFCNY